eukprot:TRINITY_DN2836_c0_g1_i6.p2 TRINITY_DN2836_c0_g1~~TRINITY_DN2836_c0_g1_i6.p2  ORF type:complete len:379 (-),score=122.34 TRINITY_DN2836_c0_g1_i6:609-1745(-)
MMSNNDEEARDGAEEGEEEFEGEENDDEEFEEFPDDDDECFGLSDVAEDVGRERHQKYLKSYKEVRNQWEHIQSDVSSYPEQKLLKTLGNFEETIVVLQGYLELLTHNDSVSKAAEVEEVQVAMSEVLAMKLQLENYLEEEKKALAEIKHYDTPEEPPEYPHASPFTITSSSSTSSSSSSYYFSTFSYSSSSSSSSSFSSSEPRTQLVSHLELFLPRIMVMRVEGIDIHTNPSQVKLQLSNACTCVVTNVVNPSSYLGKKVLVLTNACDRVERPLLIERREGLICKRALITVPDSVSLGCVVCPKDAFCNFGSQELVGADDIRNCHLSTTLYLRAGLSDVFLMQTTLSDTMGLKIKTDSRVPIGVGWQDCSVIVDWTI